jgi:vanillate/3-O-methylgallate O-demethylase
VAKSLEELLASVGNPITFLRNSQAAAFAFPVVPSEFASWRNEQHAWREGVVLFDQSYHMANLCVKGPDTIQLLTRLGVNSFSNFHPGNAKQFIACNYDGYYIGDVILLHTEPEEVWLIGRPPAMNWIQFHAEAGDYNVETTRRDRSPAETGGRALERDHYRFQIVGPKAPALFQRLNDGPVPEIRFFSIGSINIGRYKTSALRHSMAGVPGFEIWGPYQQRQLVLNEILEAGRDFGLLRGGARAYATSTGESSWIPSPVSAVYTGEKMKSYREWLPAIGYESFNSVGGSFASENIEDYYVTPFALGYERIIKFDHDFIGRDALERMAGQSQRKRVTFVWNADDLMAVMATNFGSVEGLPFKMPDFPCLNYAAAQYDRLMRDGKIVGLSMWISYSYNERAVLSVGIVDPDIEYGDVLTLVWGEEDGGTSKPTVEPHRQAEIRVRVAPSPYADSARGNRH